MDNTISKSWILVWKIIMVVLVAFLAFDAIIHILQVPQAINAFIALGIPTSICLTIGILELLFLIVFCIPRTRVLGTILLTAYLGGAVMTNLIGGTSIFGNILFPVYVGILLWGTVYVFEPSIRALLPFKE